MSKTPHTQAPEFIAALEKMGFTPARWDRAGSSDRQLDYDRAETGYPLLRIAINHEGEANPHSINIIRFDGSRSQLVQWDSTLSAHMPSAGLLALIKASL